MGLRNRIARASTDGAPAPAKTETAISQVTPEWVRRASEGSRIGQPLNGRGLPVNATGKAL